jgi:hypothetical protein
VETPQGLTPPRLVYLYGFVPLPCDAPDIQGVDDARVSLVVCGSVGCAASLVDAHEYQPADPRTGAEQLAWVTPRALRHHDVLCRLHDATTVVPLKFGTLCESLDDVHSIVDERRSAIVERLERLSGKDEWTLAWTVDDDAMAEALRCTAPELIALQGAERGLPQGHAYFARKRREKATTALVSDRLAAIERDVCERLAGASVELTPFTREPRADAASRLVASALVPRERFASFEAALADLERGYHDVRLSFDVGGPWPPYSFATVFA